MTHNANYKILKELAPTSKALVIQDVLGNHESLTKRKDGAYLWWQRDSIGHATHI